MKKYLFYIAIISLIFGCSGEKKDYALEENGATIADTASTADTTAVPKVIKTADMRFRVKDVQQTKAQLSSIVKAQGGTVAETAINTSIQESEKVKYSADSLKEITAYRKEGLMVAKIPSEKLDDFTNMVAQMAVFVDNQSLKMDDQSIAYLANKLKVQNRIEAVKTINKTAKRKGNNVETSLYIKDDYVDKKIENMQIDYRVKYSTITLSFYQDNRVNTLIVGNDNLYDYRPGFFQRLGLSILTGWSFLKEFILGVCTLWPFLALGLGIFLFIKFYLKKKN